MYSILGIVPTEAKLSTRACTWVKVALITGSRIALRHWKSKEKVGFKEWRDEPAKIASFEQLIYKINNSLNVFRNIWGPYLEVMGRNNHDDK